MLLFKLGHGSNTADWQRGRFIVPAIYAEQNLMIQHRMLIDIQTKMQQGYGEEFRRWVTVQNLKSMSKTLIFLQELGLTDVDSLAEKADAVTKHFNGIADRIKAIEARLGEITDLQKHIGSYHKTLDVYRQYRDSGWNKKFYVQHESEIIIHIENISPSSHVATKLTQKRPG